MCYTLILKCNRLPNQIGSISGLILVNYNGRREGGFRSKFFLPTKSWASSSQQGPELDSTSLSG